MTTKPTYFSIHNGKNVLGIRLMSEPPMFAQPEELTAILLFPSQDKADKAIGWAEWASNRSTSSKVYARPRRAFGAN